MCIRYLAEVVSSGVEPPDLRLEQDVGSRCSMTGNAKGWTLSDRCDSQGERIAKGKGAAEPCTSQIPSLRCSGRRKEAEAGNEDHTLDCIPFRSEPEYDKTLFIARVKIMSGRGRK